MITLAKKVFHKSLRSMGYELRRRRPAHRNTPTTSRPGICRIMGSTDGPVLVEFVGPSGVGKTTLYKQLFKGPDKTPLGLPFEQFCARDHEFAIDDAALDGSPHGQLLKHKWDSLVWSTYRTEDILSLLRYTYRILRMDVAIYRSTHTGCFLMENGLFHIFTKELLELKESVPVSFDNLLRRRAIVHFSGAPDRITANILNRKKAGDLKPLHKDRSEAELVELNRIRCALKQDLADAAEASGGRVLRIDTANTLDDNVYAIETFVRDLL